MAKAAVCKFVCEWRKEGVSGGTISYSFAARYDPTLREDQRFHEATPWGTMEFAVRNPALEGFFVPGQSYYVTLTPVEEGK